MMEKELQEKLIRTGRDFIKGHIDDPVIDAFESDQELKKPQPPLCKAASTPIEEHIKLTKDFSGLSLKNNLIDLIRDRKSSRIYTEEKMTLEQLSFLLWATQGVKSIRGKSYATLRTVPCGGARHEFETYLAVRKIEGLRPGVYHYLPMEHSLEIIELYDELTLLEDKINETLCDQRFVKKANVVFYWTMAAYRVEWRYGIFAHRVSLIDVGHVGQNLYLACTGIGVGTCGIGAFEHVLCNEFLKIDGEEEFVVYTASVGTIRDSDKSQEDAFYQFVIDEGL